MPDRKVMVIHGRNNESRIAIFTFLRAIGLDPIEWAHAMHSTGDPAAYIGEILNRAFEEAKAVVVLLTGDDEARLKKELQKHNDPRYEKEFWPQARPNVLFEAGMAFALHPRRTVIVQLGEVKPFSDIAGRHVLHLDDSLAARQELGVRLQQAGCRVNMLGSDWHTTPESFSRSRTANIARDKFSPDKIQDEQEGMRAIREKEEVNILSNMPDDRYATSDRLAKTAMIEEGRCIDLLERLVHKGLAERYAVNDATVYKLSKKGREYKGRAQVTGD